MSAAGGKGGPARPPRASWPRRLLRFGLWTVAVVVVLLVLAWVFRRQVVAPLLLPRLEAVLAEALDAERVSIGALDGDWLTGVEVRDFVVTGGRGVVRELRVGRALADYSPVALLGGDLQGLLRATVRADAAVLDLRPAPDADAAPDDGAAPFDPAALEPLLALCRAGAEVHCANLRLVAPNGERQGALAVTLRPGAADRTLTLRYAGLEVDARIASRAAAGGRVEATVAMADPGAVLDLFAVGVGVHGGDLRADLTATLEPLAVTARVDLADLSHGERRLSASRIEARVDRERLAVDRATIDLPGLSAELQGLSLPSPFADGAMRLDALAGQFAVRIDDLSPQATLLPGWIDRLMPIQGQLVGAFADGRLRLDASELHARGMDLTVQRGSYPLTSADWRAAEGSLEFGLALRDFAMPLDGLGELRGSGTVDGRVSGSLAASLVDVTVDLGACATAPVTFASAAGRLRYGPDGIAVEGLQVRGLAVTALGPDSPVRLDLDGTCRLRDGGLDPDTLRVRGVVGGPVPPDLCAALADTGDAPVAVGYELHFDAAHGRDGVVLETLRARTDDGAPLTIAVDAGGTVPLHWDGANVQPLERGDVDVQVRASVGAAGEPTAPALDAMLRLGPRSVSLHLGEARAGSLQVQGDVDAGLGLADVLTGEVAWAAVPIRAALDVPAVDLSRLPTAWFGGVDLAGQVTGRVHADGRAGGLAPDVELRWTDGALRAPGWPSLDGVTFALGVGKGEGEGEDATELRAQLGATLAEDVRGLSPEVALDLSARSDADGTRLLPSVVRLGGGALRVQLATDVPRARLLAGAVDVAATDVTGTVALEEFALDRLPPSLLGVDSLLGTATGRVELEGTLGAPLPSLVRRATLSLRDGGLKVASVPRFERLAAELAYEPGELRVVQATGVLGAGVFEASGVLRGDDLIGGLDDATIALHLAGDDLLLYRGDGAKVRATAALEVTGTAADARVGGRIELGRGSKYVRRISIVPDLSTRGGEAVNEGLQLVELPPALGGRLTFDVQIATAEPFEVRTTVFDGEVDVAAALRGKGTAPRIEGTMSLRTGVLRFPGANLRIDSGQLTFTRSEPLFPDLNVTATGKRMGFVVSMAISGRYDRPQVQLSSVPPLPPQDLVVLLTTGQLPSTLVERGAEGQARFVGGYLAKEVLETWFGSESTERGESMLDRLTIETGREVSKNGAESVLVEYELEPRLALQVERDEYEDYNLGLVLRWRFP